MNPTGEVLDRDIDHGTPRSTSLSGRRRGVPPKNPLRRYGGYDLVAAASMSRRWRTTRCVGVGDLPAGGVTGGRFAGSPRQAAIVLPASKSTAPRERSLIVDEISTGLQYRSGLPGPCPDIVEQQQCLAELRSAAASARFVVASGSLSAGCTLRPLREQVALVRRRSSVRADPRHIRRAYGTSPRGVSCSGDRSEPARRAGR